MTNLWVSAPGGLTMGFSLFFFFFFFFFFWGGVAFMGVGSVIRGRHGWWSPAWEASLASLLAWG